MFLNATSFNQPLDNWELNNLERARYFLYNSGMDIENYSKSLIGWANNPNTNTDIHMICEEYSEGELVIDENPRGMLYNTAGKDARNILTDQKGWLIDCDLYVPQ